jgi:hypothetical protein
MSTESGNAGFIRDLGPAVIDRRDSKSERITTESLRENEIAGVDSSDGFDQQ